MQFLKIVLNRCSETFVRCANILRLAVNIFISKQLNKETAALSYSTLLAIVPIFSVIFAIARGFGYNKYIEYWFMQAFESQPQVAEVLVSFVNSYLVHTKSGVLLGFGLVLMLCTVLLLLTNIERVFNIIWHANKSRSIFRTCTDYLSLFLLLPVVLVLSTGISLYVSTIADGVRSQAIVASALFLLIDVLPYVIMSLFFIGLFVFVPNTHVKVRHCILPGIIAGIAMQSLQYAYIHSQIWVSSYNAIYGSFAALPLFILWVQLSWFICLFGSVLSFSSQNISLFDFSFDKGNISHSNKILLCLNIMAIISRQFEKGLPPFSITDIVRETKLPMRIVNNLLCDLVNAQLLVEIVTDEKSESIRYMPGMSAETLTVGVVVGRLESYGHISIPLPEIVQSKEKWNEVHAKYRQYLSAMNSVLVRDL